MTPFEIILLIATLVALSSTTYVIFRFIKNESMYTEDNYANYILLLITGLTITLVIYKGIYGFLYFIPEFQFYSKSLEGTVSVKGQLVGIFSMIAAGFIMMRAGRLTRYEELARLSRDGQ